MYVIGLTGGMAAGKSTVASCFRYFHVPVFDADLCVRNLQKPHGKSLPKIEKAFPGVVHNNQLDREKLRTLIARDPKLLRRLEKIIHPLVRKERKDFVHSCRRQGAKLCVLDIPLLWETGAQRDCDLVIVASAPLRIRLKRLQDRFEKQKKMTPKEALKLMSRQLPEAIKSHRADIIIKTGLSMGETMKQVSYLIKILHDSRLYNSV
ncbi:dephospho-CoA kinase [Aristophania vespae]|uniref:Dephospho-CoA kinase n=1 Tax=Aristophania vespae TaxID=2697033 RepID=A0A6P1NDY5_9PROT|nr:dephospho-CoA kinase [Aristophania vespae]QHI95653.1 dephospho-CoA kinase [Aristophania vespae]